MESRNTSGRVKARIIVPNHARIRSPDLPSDGRSTCVGKATTGAVGDEHVTCVDNYRDLLCVKLAEHGGRERHQRHLYQGQEANHERTAVVALDVVEDAVVGDLDGAAIQKLMKKLMRLGQSSSSLCGSSVLTRLDGISGTWTFRISKEM